MLDITTQANLLVEKMSKMAIGQLYSQLGFLALTNRWFTKRKIENGGTFTIPLLGTASSNTRAPGDKVVDQTPSPTKRTVTIVEEESSFQMDPTWMSSEGMIDFFEQQVVNHTNALAEAVMMDILNIIASSLGIAAVGTLGADITKTHMDAMKLALNNSAIPKEPRLAIISGEMENALGDIDEYSDYDSGGIPGIHALGMVKRASGFFIKETPYCKVPAANQHQGFACWPQSIWSVFPMQETFNKGETAVKTESEIDGLRLYMLREYVSGYNGSERITLSIRYGLKIGRDAGVIRIDGK